MELYKRVGIKTLQENGLWRKMADCFLKLDNLPAAVNLYVELANGKKLSLAICTLLYSDFSDALLILNCIMCLIFVYSPCPGAHLSWIQLFLQSVSNIP